MKPVSLHEVLRLWIAAKKGDRSQRAFAKDTGLYESDLSNLFKGKGGRQATVEWVAKIVAAEGIALSQAFLEMGDIAWRLEKQQAVPHPEDAEDPPAEDPPRPTKTIVEGQPVEPDAPVPGTQFDERRAAEPSRRRDEGEGQTRRSDGRRRGRKPSR